MPHPDTMPSHEAWVSQLTVDMQLTPEFLLLDYMLRGDVTQFVFDDVSKAPCRKDLLWKRTCLEAFLPEKGSSYRELNVAPSHDWNFYYFSDYRQGQTVESDIKIHLSSERSESLYQLQVRVERLESLLSIHKIGLSVILQDKQEGLSYWALKHPSAHADFHHRDSFLKFK